MQDELFRKMLVSAAQDAQVSLRQIEARQQAPDHPILWNVPETDYLKFYLFQVVWMFLICQIMEENNKNTLLSMIIMLK